MLGFGAPKIYLRAYTTISSLLVILDKMNYIAFCNLVVQPRWLRPVRVDSLPITVMLACRTAVTRRNAFGLVVPKEENAKLWNKGYFSWTTSENPTMWLRVIFE